ncbi:MAG TPA: NAD-dependent epimerase/dehydratase family protein [Clostridia bacterium]|nr:NAD-dependent epimerase/dehydratase family protein [Clostridia bacterium]
MGLERFGNKLTEPSQGLIEDFNRIDGDILILGMGGKMGSDLGLLAKRAIDESGGSRRVIGVSRFSDGKIREGLKSQGIETISCDLEDERQLAGLPQVKNVIYMVGKKFGTTGDEHTTWGINTYLPGGVAEKYKDSKIVVFSTGNVYPLTRVGSGGSCEEDDPDPVGEYAQSCLGRERIFEYFARRNGTQMAFLRLNYANDLRYGVLYEIAKSVREGRAIDLSTGHVNLIWQGDANEYALRAFNHCTCPPNIINAAGPEIVSIRWLATLFGKGFEKEPIFINKEGDTALLSNGSKGHRLFGYPRVTLRDMVEWQIEWLNVGGEVLDKPTHYQERGGNF